jgi:hypothetical protein
MGCARRIGVRKFKEGVAALYTMEKHWSEPHQALMQLLLLEKVVLIGEGVDAGKGLLGVRD